MAKNTASKEKAPKKRRWYHNLADAYRITKRTYGWITWALIGAAVVMIALGVLIAAVTDRSWVMWTITGILFALLADMSLLSFLVRRAMYAQIDGKVGSVYAVTSQIRRGWIISDQPVAANKEQDLIWRLIGRPGVVLVTEGPTQRVQSLVNQEKRKIHHATLNVPVIVINVGNEEGQVPLGKLQGHLRHLKKKLTTQEVPVVSQRLNALNRNLANIPKGVDPNKVRMNRRALRGR